ncbi:MAG: hypothetical protein FD136_1420 [Chitinophagaceae bacterium]|nr:MAG: hypothetical protein FD136_1420 [Chitinophagaceae bacterium]
MIQKFQNLGTVLSRKDQREIVGGARYGVSCTTANGYHQESIGYCTGTQANCQASANSYCSTTAGCVSCTLGGIV